MQWRFLNARLDEDTPSQRHEAYTVELPAERFRLGWFLLGHHPSFFITHE